MRWQTFVWPSVLRGLSLLVCVLSLGHFAPVWADYQSARAHFHRQDPLSQVSITIGLSATGDFDGLLNFGFTRRYYNAIVSFETREGLVPDGILLPEEKEVLDSRASSFLGPLGFANYTHPVAGSILLVPRGAFTTEMQTKRGFSFEREDKTLSLNFVSYDTSEKSFAELFSTLTRASGERTVAYKVQRANYFVVNGLFRGRSYYTWMSAIPGRSTGFTVSWSGQWENSGQRIAIIMANFFSPVPVKSQPAQPNAESDQVENPPQPNQAPDTPKSGSGTGFKVTSAGHVLTNYHVAGRCKSIAIRKTAHLPISASLVASDQTNDLALILAASPLSGMVANFHGGPVPRAGAEIAVFGFPLATVLADGGNIVTGNITALSGLGNDSRMFQISAPVQPGNSGGPVLSRQGYVLGVVVSKLDSIPNGAKDRRHTAECEFCD